VPVDEREGPAGSDQPLMWAIFEMREVVTRQIEEFKATLASREVPVEAPEPVTLVAAEPIAAPAEAELRPRRTAGRPVVREPAPDAPAATEEPPPARPEDARQRLDALARLLDKRVRQSHGTGGDTVARPGES
jgi:hypothetical protein